MIQNEIVKAGKWWNFWIGLRKVCSNCDWSWDDGAPVDYETWNDGEPNDANEGKDNIVAVNLNFV